MNSKHSSGTKKQTRLDSYELALSLPFAINTAINKKYCKYQRDGHWNQKEKLKYAIFLGFFRDLFDDPSKRKSIRIYEMMSDMIITRNANQCRSHHQKMEKYRSTTGEIISSVAQKYGPTLYKEIQSKYLTLIKVLLQNKDKYTKSSQRSPRYLNPTPNPNPNNTISQPQPPSSQTHPHPDSSNHLKLMVPICPEVKKYRNKQTAASFKQDESQCSDDSFQNMSYIVPDEEEKCNVANSIDHHEINTSSHAYGFQPFFPITHFYSYDGVSLNSRSASVCEEQIRLFKVERDLHLQKIEQLKHQIYTEEQYVTNCNNNIKLYELSLSNMTSLPSLNQ